MSVEVEEYVAISGLQHLIFCERQAALIHVERVWLEDGATAAGRVFHERADDSGMDSRALMRSARSVPLISERLKLRGFADVVEYRRESMDSAWRPRPVEYKRGTRKKKLADRVQLCAQALCLEEMHNVQIDEAELFYGASHRRVLVSIDVELREQTVRAIQRLHQLVRENLVPPGVFEKKCSTCSLEPLCLPAVTSNSSVVERYMASIFEA